MIGTLYTTHHPSSSGGCRQVARGNVEAGWMERDSERVRTGNGRPSPAPADATLVAMASKKAGQHEILRVFSRRWPAHPHRIQTSPARASQLLPGVRSTKVLGCSASTTVGLGKGWGWRNTEWALERTLGAGARVRRRGRSGDKHHTAPPFNERWPPCIAVDEWDGAACGPLQVLSVRLADTCLKQ